MLINVYKLSKNYDQIHEISIRKKNYPFTYQKSMKLILVIFNAIFNSASAKHDAKTILYIYLIRNSVMFNL